METGVQRVSLHCIINRLSEYSMYQKDISLNTEHVNASDFCSGGARFESRLERLLSRLRIFVGFLRVSRRICVSFCYRVRTDPGARQALSPKCRPDSFCEVTRSYSQGAGNLHCDSVGRVLP
jgi:hypothetical protein